LGLGRDSLEGCGQFEEFEEMPKLREKVLASDLQKREGKPVKISAVNGSIITGGIDGK
jgi:hypothetical protein